MILKMYLTYQTNPLYLSLLSYTSVVSEGSLENFFKDGQKLMPASNLPWAQIQASPAQDSNMLEIFNVASLKFHYYSKQKMGNCTCNAVKTISDETSNELGVEQGGHPQDQNGLNHPSKQANEKRRGKNALLITNSEVQIQDNVNYDQQAEISPNDFTQIKKALKKHFIFSQLSEQQIDCFTKQMKPCTANRNSYIFRQGDKSGAYYIILEGVCQVEINGEKKRTLTYGDTFGDLGIIYNAPRSASVFAVTDCQLVEISRKIFKKVMEDINQLHDKQNRKFLEVLSFFKELTEDQKNAIASCCLTETYEEGQVIFNQGDDANSFYVIQEGTVIIKQKGHQLKAKDCFGQNSILVEGGVRTNTLIAKTHVKIISMSRQNIKTSLGDSLKNIIRKNVIAKILSESSFQDTITLQKLTQSLDNAEFIHFKKGEVVMKKNTQYKNCVLVLLNTGLKSQNFKFNPNSVVQLDQITSRKPIKIKQDMIAQDEGELCKIKCQLDKAGPSPISIKVKEEPAADEEKSLLEKKMQISDFQVVRKLREGNFGKVYVCYNTKISKLYAIKVLDRHYVEKSQIIQYIMNEEEILRTVPRNPFIVSFYKLLKDTNFIYFIMEFIEGQDLFDVITKVISFSIEHARFLIGQVLLMMEHLHTNRIIYRDLKPQNLMMNTDGYLTLVDMGTAKRLKIERRFRTNTIIGTPHYIAPEIITGKGYSFPADLWSLGVLTYELLCGKLPFGQNSEDPFSIYEEIVNMSVKFPRNCPKSSKAFIEKMLTKSPQHRMGGGYEQLKKHIFFEGLDWKGLQNKTLDSFYKPSDDVKVKPGQIQKALGKEKYKAPNKFLSDKSSK